MTIDLLEPVSLLEAIASVHWEHCLTVHVTPLTRLPFPSSHACLLSHQGQGLVDLVCLVCLVSLVCFVYLVDLVHLVCFVQPNERDKPNKPDKPVLVSANKIDQIDQTNEINKRRLSQRRRKSLQPQQSHESLRPRPADRRAIAASAEKVPGVFSRVWTLGGANFMEPAGCRKRFVTVC